MGKLKGENSHNHAHLGNVPQGPAGHRPGPHLIVCMSGGCWYLINGNFRGLILEAHQQQLEATKSSWVLAAVLALEEARGSLPSESLDQDRGGHLSEKVQHGERSRQVN